MIIPEVLEVLRCPIDPKREAKLIVDDDVRLLCERCRVQFKIREGFPSLLTEEAVLPDGAAASLLRTGAVDLVLVGADRITANGDVANKIGTYGVALAAREHGVPMAGE